MAHYRLIYWCIVVAIILEMLSPVPLALTLGSLYVILVKPAWFAVFVRQLYEAPTSDQIDGSERE